MYRADARGHGGTRWDAADGFTTADLVADVIAFADALGLGAFHLLGFSMGATTALNVAAAHAARLRSLVVIGISPDRSRGPVSRGTRWTPSGSSARPRLGATSDAPIRSGAARVAPLLPAIAADVEDQRLLTAAEIHAIECPTGTNGSLAAGDQCRHSIT